MKKLNETYAKWFNTRHRRVGHLFQGRFKNILVERESHLLELTRYIVLNPVRRGAVRYAGDWKWSNYRATAGLMRAPSWLETDWTLAKFDLWDRAQGREAYRRFVAEARGSEYKPWESLVGQIYLGGEAFCEIVQRIVDSQPRSSRAYPRAQVELVRPTLIFHGGRGGRPFADRRRNRGSGRREARRAAPSLRWPAVTGSGPGCAEPHPILQPSTSRTGSFVHAVVDSG